MATVLADVIAIIVKINRLHIITLLQLKFYS